eukprot:m.182635 g.182635  ORF g.182635 m.182635 type:complete len:495 (-) comp32124_c0_seq1:10-1494(-)
MQTQPPSRTVIDAIKAHIELEATIVGRCDAEHAARSVVENTHKLGATLLHCNPQEVFFPPDAIVGLRLVVKELNFHSHQSILYHGFDSFPQNCTEATIEEIPSTVDGCIDLEALELMLCAAHDTVAMVAIHHGLGSDGGFEVDDMCAIIKRTTAVALIDMSKTLGLVPVPLGFDVVIASSTGALQGPRGTALMMIRSCTNIKPDAFDADGVVVAFGSAYTTSSNSFAAQVGLGAALANRLRINATIQSRSCSPDTRVTADTPTAAPINSPNVANTNTKNDSDNDIDNNNGLTHVDSVNPNEITTPTSEGACVNIPSRKDLDDLGWIRLTASGCSSVSGTMSVSPMAGSPMSHSPRSHSPMNSRRSSIDAHFNTELATVSLVACPSTTTTTVTPNAVVGMLSKESLAAHHTSLSASMQSQQSLDTPTDHDHDHEHGNTIDHDVSLESCNPLSLSFCSSITPLPIITATTKDHEAPQHYDDDGYENNNNNNHQQQQ